MNKLKNKIDFLYAHGEQIRGYHSSDCDLISTSLDLEKRPRSLDSLVMHEKHLRPIKVK